MQVTIHYLRPLRGTTLYVEDLLADDGRGLVTYRVVPDDDRLALSQAFWKAGLLPGTTVLGAVRKHYYYAENFDVIACFDVAGRLAGYYTDIVTPLEKANGEFRLTDLFLDFWLAPGQPPRELDQDEFDDAVAHGVLTAEQEASARAAFVRLRREIAAGIFPYRYIRT